jgi:hypothetical protein
MLDELELLSTDERLFQLLSHYAHAGAGNPLGWHDRCMELLGAEPRELVKLHGLLIAHQWLDQNTGSTPLLKRGIPACCYRITAAGLRALERAEERRLLGAAAEPEPAR